MDKKQTLFIYDRREIIVLFLLGIILILFTFTLGLHFGKRISAKRLTSSTQEISPIESLIEPTPPLQDLINQAENAQQNVEDILDQNLHDEVIRTQTHLKIPYQTQLPEHTLSTAKGATTLESLETQLEAPTQFTLQVGSYPSFSEAKKQLSFIQLSNLKAFLKEATIEGKGKWYRIYVGAFQSRSEAQQIAEKYKQEHKISSYIITQLIK